MPHSAKSHVVLISVETRTHRERDKMPRTPDFGCCCCCWCKVAWSFSEACRCLSETVAQRMNRYKRFPKFFGDRYK